MGAILRERSYLLDELGDPGAPKGSRLWALWVGNEIRKALYDTTQSSSRLRSMVELFKEYAGWQELGCLTWEDFCAKRLQTEAEKIETEVMRRAKEAGSIGANGGDRRSEQFQSNNYNTEKLEDRGTSLDYLTARIARDRPDILEDMKEGKYRSVRQAAIEAGIVNARVRYSLPDDPIAAGRYLAQRVDKDWLLSMVDEFMKSIKE